MNYELAKELKEAGFPQKKCEKAYYVNAGSNTGGIVDLSNYKEADNEFWLYKLVACPTLSELIEGCVEGKHYFDLDNSFSENGNEIRVIWAANTPTEIGEGSTPEEAVARLWLALNKK
jgi:hypothetical protein